MITQKDRDEIEAIAQASETKRVQTKSVGQWIPISERLPEFPCFILRNGSPYFYEHAVFPATVTDWTEQQKAGATHWMAFVAPDPKTDDEGIFREWWKSKGRLRFPFAAQYDAAKSSFLAGLALGRKEK